MIDGVRDLLSERWAEDAALVKVLREWLWEEGLLQSRKMDGKDELNPDVAKYRDYFDYSEPIRTVPSHRALAVFAPHAGDPGRQADPRRGTRRRPAGAWPKAASRATWAGPTASARATT